MQRPPHSLCRKSGEGEFLPHLSMQSGVRIPPKLPEPPYERAPQKLFNASGQEQVPSEPHVRGGRRLAHATRHLWRWARRKNSSLRGELRHTMPGDEASLATDREGWLLENGWEPRLPLHACVRLLLVHQAL